MCIRDSNSTANDVNEQIIKGNIAIIKHTDDGETQIETPETGATFEGYLKDAGSYDAAKETERDIPVSYTHLMSVEQVAQFTGYNKNSVSRWCGKKELKCFYIKQRYQIPKEYLLDFLVSRYFIGIAVKSVKPVSYTHLDVYKRQVFFGWRYQRKQRQPSLFCPRP